MKLLIFMKRYLKSKLFYLSLLCVFVLAFLYTTVDLNSSDNLKIGIIDKTDNCLSQNLIDKLLTSSGYFKYIKYSNEENLLQDLKSENINYGFEIDLNSDEKFIQYSFDDNFSGIAREDIYSNYFEITTSEYTKNLLKLDEQKYKTLYDKYIKQTFSFNYEDKFSGKVFPLFETSSLLILALNTLTIYDYFILESNSKYFQTVNGRKNKSIFILAAILINSGLFLILLKHFIDIDIKKYLLYIICIYLYELLLIKLLSRKYFLIYMPLTILLSMISITAVNIKTSYSYLALLFLNNCYTKSQSSIIYLIIPLIILSVLNLTINLCHYRNDGNL
ncbi:hypothetical protein [Peptoniphilus mikwangii]|uniref:hypothetical protein n=1 Tax=Peptoniphilus mikwangii TaxID=1354300 RepID=UPI0003F862BE|nr:hypothetical protein [Peptoniphilus mikwangii]